MTTIVDRLLPDEDAEALLGLAHDICTKELAPQVADMEEKAAFPEAAYRLLGRSGLLSLPFPEVDGGGGQAYEVYLQVVEEIATAWPSVGVGTSVHSLTATVVAANGTEQMRGQWLPKLLSGVPSAATERAAATRSLTIRNERSPRSAAKSICIRRRSDGVCSSG